MIITIKCCIVSYKTINNKKPFDVWLDSFDKRIRLRIVARLDRSDCGNLGDWKRVDQELFEVRLHFGEGYRIYFCLDKDTVVLLCGGTKATQKKDIHFAKTLIKEYKERFR